MTPEKTTVSLLASMPAHPSTSWKLHLLERLDSQYAFYHRQWWCHQRLFYRFKPLQAWSNGLALIIVAAGLLVGPILENSVLVACLAAAGTLTKGWNNFKKWSSKIQMSRFAYTNFTKTLTELRTLVSGDPKDDLGSFLVKMQTLDDIVTDFSPPVSDWCVLVLFPGGTELAVPFVFGHVQNVGDLPNYPDDQDLCTGLLRLVSFSSFGGSFYSFSSYCQEEQQASPQREVPRRERRGVGFSQMAIANQAETRGKVGCHPHDECNKISPVVVFIGEEKLEDVKWELAVSHVWNNFW